MLCKLKTIFSGGDEKEMFGEKLCCEAGLLRYLQEQCIIHQKVLSLHPFSESKWHSETTQQQRERQDACLEGISSGRKS